MYYKVSRLTLIAAAVLTGMAAYAVVKNVPALSTWSQCATARVQAWQKITPRVRAADLNGRETADRREEFVRAFFADRKRHSRDFGEAVLSLSGKWAFIKSKLPYSDGDSHRQYLRERFAQIVVSGPELQDLIQSVVAGYINELQGIENDLLVQIRADLSDSDLARFETGAMLRTDEAFRNEYAKSLEQIAAVVQRDVMIQVGRETVAWVSADIATNITISLATALAERLGVSAGVLGTGVASGTLTLGVGIAAGLVLDAILDWVLKIYRHDPAGEIAWKVDRRRLDMFQGAYCSTAIRRPCRPTRRCGGSRTRTCFRLSVTSAGRRPTGWKPAAISDLAMS